MAQLYIDGQLKGLHMFYVQLREEGTHEPRPGVHIGELGKKMGFLGVNNGFLGMKNVRIPRTRMLMRHAQVHRDGTYVKSPVEPLTYFAMLSTRCIVARNSAVALACAATIATRFSAVRRQSPIDTRCYTPYLIIKSIIAEVIPIFQFTRAADLGSCHSTAEGLSRDSHQLGLWLSLQLPQGVVQRDFQGH